MNRAEPNIIALQAWGKFPQSRRRRKQAMRSFLARTLIFLGVLVVGVIISGFIIATSPRHFRVDGLGSTFFCLVMGIGFLFCLATPFQMENRFSGGRALRANFHDYHLAGVSGRDILMGMAGPQIAGILLFAIIYGVAVVATFLIACQLERSGPGRELFIAFTLIVLIAESSLIVGGLYAIAQWTRYSEKSLRLFKTGSFMLFNPFLITSAACVIVPKYRLFPYYNSTLIIYMIAATSLAIWVMVAAKAWRAAIRRLQSSPEAVMG